MNSTRMFLEDMNRLFPDWVSDAPLYDKTLSWIHPYESRLYRAVLVDEKTVHISSFVSVVNDMPPTYVLGTHPNWITERIAVLRMMDIPPPPHRIDEIGMRVDEKTFWIIAPKDA